MPQSRSEKAQADLDVATRKVEKLKGRIADLKAELERAEVELTETVARRDYLAQNPDLPKQNGQQAASKPETVVNYTTK